ncbi:MAG: hypothetical protein Q8P61_09645 [Candidatus Nanopelagicales bacterium]|nr:hypothetical protein [Candidatus Nanopelagicales bacterium]
MIDMGSNVQMMSFPNHSASSRLTGPAVALVAAATLVTLAGCGASANSVVEPTREAAVADRVTLADGSVITAGEGTTLELDGLGNASGRSGQEEIVIQGTGLFVDNVVARIYTGPTFKGHHHIYTSTGSIDKNQSNHNPIITLTVPVSKKLPNHTQVCAEAWRDNGGGNYTLMGRPCLVVTN